MGPVPAATTRVGSSAPGVAATALDLELLQPSIPLWNQRTVVSRVFFRYFDAFSATWCSSGQGQSATKWSLALHLRHVFHVDLRRSRGILWRTTSLLHWRPDNLARGHLSLLHPPHMDRSTSK